MSVERTATESAARRPFARGRLISRALPADSATLVAFTVGDTVRESATAFAAPVENVERVLRYVAPTQSEHAPAWADGVILYRGRNVPVFDMQQRLYGTVAEIQNATRMVVFNLHGAWLAAVVSAVPEVMMVEAASILPASASCAGLSSAYLLGAVTHRNTPVLVLDVAKVLTAGELLSLQDWQQRLA